MSAPGQIVPRHSAPLALDLDTRSAPLRRLWPRALRWIEPYYDRVHLEQAVVWLLRIDPDASEPLLVAALTHDMERQFPGGPRLDKRTGAWDDLDYNSRHAERSARIVGAWLRDQQTDDAFAARVAALILEHEFGGSEQGNKLQAADSLSFLDVNGVLAARWIENGETSLEHALRKLDWMYERIALPDAQELARPLYEDSRELVIRVAAERATARESGFPVPGQG